MQTIKTQKQVETRKRRAGLRQAQAAWKEAFDRYCAANREAKANGTARPHIDSYITDDLKWWKK